MTATMRMISKKAITLPSMIVRKMLLSSVVAVLAGVLVGLVGGPVESRQGKNVNTNDHSNKCIF